MIDYLVFRFKFWFTFGLVWYGLVCFL